MIGYGDNIGSGFQKILSAWNTLGFIRPELKELSDVKEVWLTLPLIQTFRKGGGTCSEISTVNSTINSTVNFLNGTFGKIELSDTQVILLRNMIENPIITIAELSTVTGLDRNAVNYQLKKLRTIINIKRAGSNKKGQWIISLKEQI